MLSAGSWKVNQPNTVLFVLVDGDGNEAQGLGAAFTVQLSKGGAVFQAGLGTKAEVGLGWYRYVAIAAEADTPGPVALVVTGSGVVQQNLEYVVETRVVTAIEFTYTVLSSAGNVPVEGVAVQFQIGTTIVWAGTTDVFGVARDEYGNLPKLDPGTYTVISRKGGFNFPIDTETVS